MVVIKYVTVVQILTLVFANSVWDISQKLLWNDVSELPGILKKSQLWFPVQTDYIEYESAFRSL